MIQTIAPDMAVTFLKGGTVKNLTIYGEGGSWLVRFTMHDVEGNAFLRSQFGVGAQRFDTYEEAQKAVVDLSRQAYPEIYALIDGNEQKQTQN